MQQPIPLSRFRLIWRWAWPWSPPPSRAPRQVAATLVSGNLPSGQARRLTLRRGETLFVRQGRLWLTREGDPTDHVLWPGSGYVAAVPQEVVIEAVGGQLCCYERHRLCGT